MRFRILENQNEIACTSRTSNDKFVILTKKSVEHITMQHNLHSKIAGGSKFNKDYDARSMCELFTEMSNKITIKKDNFYGREIKMGRDVGYFLIGDKKDLETYKEYQPKWYASDDPNNKGRKDIGEEIISVPSLVFPKEHQSKLLQEFKTDIISVYTVLFNSEISTLDISQFNELVYVMISLFPGGLKTRNGMQITTAQNWDNSGIGVVLFD